MKAEYKLYDPQSRVVESSKSKGVTTLSMMDNRDNSQMRLMKTIQCMGMEEEDLQMKPIAQLQSEDYELLPEKVNAIQQKPNNTGLPDNLKSGVESMSGFSMDDVRVHYNSDKPAQMYAI